MAKDLSQVIEDSASGPAEVTGDSGGMKQHPLKDVIESDRYLSSKDASRRKNRGLNFAKFSPPGAA